MSIKLLYFAGLRETLGCSGEELPALPEGVSTVGGLREWLCQRGGDWSVLRAGMVVRMAVNQTLTNHDAPLADGDEVAFFPPVTGG
jgi:sulfur-carrier protein